MLAERQRRDELESQTASNVSKQSESEDVQRLKHELQKQTNRHAEQMSVEEKKRIAALDIWQVCIS